MRRAALASICLLSATSARAQTVAVPNELQFYDSTVTKTSKIRSLIDGRMTFSKSDDSNPIVTWFDAGFLRLDAGLNASGAIHALVSSATVPVAPFTCDATRHGYFFFAHDTDHGLAGGTRLCYCGDSHNGTTVVWNWINATTGSTGAPCP